MSDALTDSLLLEALCKGDVDSFEELFIRYRSRVYGVVFHVLGNREEAEELTQEVFIRLYRHRFRDREEHNLLAWLYRVATNLSFNALRSRKRERERMAKPGVYSHGQALPADPQDEAVRLEERETVRAIVDTLPEKQRACLLLRHMGLSYAEISQVIGISPGSVGTMLARAEHAFKERYLVRQRKELV